METYHKIQTLFKRHLDGPKKGKMIRGDWTTPELAYLADNDWEFTEKVDGTNIRIGLELTEDDLTVDIRGRTDAAVIPTPLMVQLRKTFASSPTGSGEGAVVGRWMIDHGLSSVILFGEGYGPKIQGGGKYVQSVIEANRRIEQDPLSGINKMPEHKFVLFDVKIGNFWLTRDNVDDVAKQLGIESVPTIGHGTLHEAIDVVSTGLTFGTGGRAIRWGRGRLDSQWGNFEAEGIVARPSVAMFDRRGERIITKVKSVDFK